METINEMRKCAYSSPYGGEWVNGYFHRWTDTNEKDACGSTTRAIIEDAETGAIHLISIGNFQFVS